MAARLLAVRPHPHFACPPTLPPSVCYLPPPASVLFPPSRTPCCCCRLRRCHLSISLLTFCPVQFGLLLWAESIVTSGGCFPLLPLLQLLHACTHAVPYLGSLKTRHRWIIWMCCPPFLFWGTSYRPFSSCITVGALRHRRFLVVAHPASLQFGDRTQFQSQTSLP